MSKSSRRSSLSQISFPWSKVADLINISIRPAGNHATTVVHSISRGMVVDRRQAVTAAFGAAASSLFVGSAFAHDSKEPTTGRVTAYNFSFPALNGGEIKLGESAGRPILIVNTASHCEYTPQYAGMQELWTKFHQQGLMVVAVPSNDFGKKEPGSAADIDRLVHGQYGVTFPVTAKTLVRGSGAHPFYQWVVAERPQDPPTWNFQKYLISREGYIDAAFAPEIEPTNAAVQTAIGRALAAS